MPGIHFIHSNTGKQLPDRIGSVLENLKHSSGYQSEIIYRNDNLLLAVTRYPEYPLQVYDTTDYLAVLEGRIHGMSRESIAADLESLISDLFEEDFSVKRIQPWILKHDGDYILMVLDKKTSRWILINDALGRLPVYYCQSDGISYISRELRFISGSIANQKIDRMALAQYLLFGFPLGERTLLKEVNRLSPGACLRLHRETEQILEQTVYQFAFDPRTSSDSRAKIADKLVALFISACRTIIEDGDNAILSLSGGLDSRAVAAGLIAAGHRFKAVTYEDVDKIAALDIVYARELSEKLGIDWQPIHLSAPNGSDAYSLLMRKGGANSTAMAFYVPFMNEIENRWGRPIVYITGDGGDKALPPLRPARRLNSDDELVNFIVARHKMMPLDLLTELLDIPQADILAVLKDRVRTYPEESSRQKYVHFMIYERAVKWLFEGEDRNRSFFWSCTPFYCLPFFREAMACPDRYKSNHRLYSDFLKRLSPTAAGVVDMNRGVAVTSLSYRYKEAVFSFMARYPGLTRSLKNRLSPTIAADVSSPLAECVKRQAEMNPEIYDYFNREKLRQVADNPGCISRVAFHNLLTVTSAIEMHQGRRQSYDAFARVAFC